MNVVGPKSLYKSLAYEFNIFLSFSWRDWSAIIIPGALFSYGTLHGSQLGFTSTIFNFIFAIIWRTFCLYFFNISNQITGVDEDRINKPDRPIPSGKISLPGAQTRWVSTLITLLVLSLAKPSHQPETICWLLIVAFLSLTEAGNHWFGKNCVAMMAVTWVQLKASWKAIAPLTPQTELRILVIALWMGITFNTQDLRDTKGDEAVGRKTLPIVFGDGGSRWIMVFVLLSLGVSALWMGGIVQISPLIVIAMHVFLGWRIMQKKGPQYDHKTYMINTYINCFLCALSSSSPN